MVTLVSFSLSLFVFETTQRRPLVSSDDLGVVVVVMGAARPETCYS
jgi:hypothetical protein